MKTALLSVLAASVLAVASLAACGKPAETPAAGCSCAGDGKCSCPPGHCNCPNCKEHGGMMMGDGGMPSADDAAPGK